MNEKRRTLTTGTAIGYSVAGIADAGLYNFVFMYFLFFLTNVAHIKPAFAGTIILVATLCDIIITPFVSQLSDNRRAGTGRRRVFILAAAIPIFIAVILMFSVFDMGEAFKNVYYMAVTIVFWITFGVFVVPYYALAPELTDVQEERTKLRIPFLVFNGMGNLLGMAAPMAIIGYFMTKGFSDSKAWLIFIIVLAGISSASLLITYFSTKGKEIPIEALPVREDSENVFIVYSRILRLKPTKYLISITAIYMIVYCMVISSLTYFVIYNLRKSESDISVVTLLMVVTLMFLAPVICSIAVKFERNKVLAYILIAVAAIMVLFRFAGITSVSLVVMYLIIFGAANAAYWGLVQAMFYDLAEVYEYKYGKRVEGAVVGLNIIGIKVFSAVAVQILGLLLQLGNYDASLVIQTDTALSMIYRTFTVIPACLLLAAGILSMLNPVNKVTYELLIDALDSKRRNEEHSLDGLKRIV